MDKKDEIILQQLDVIRTMTQNNLNRMGSDFWGAPLTPDAPKSAVPKEAAPKANAPKSADGAKPNKPAASTGADEKKEEEAPLPPPEKNRSLSKKICPSVMEMTLVGMYADTSPACVSMIGSAVMEPPPSASLKRLDRSSSLECR